jgi:hypothetical protein
MVNNSLVIRIIIRTVNAIGNAWLVKSERPQETLVATVDLTLAVDLAIAVALEVRPAARTDTVTLITIVAAVLEVAADDTLEADHIIAPAPSRKNVALT